MVNGSLQKKSSSKYWYAVISQTDTDGKFKTKWISTRSDKKTEAKQVLRRILQEMESGIYVDKSKLLFCDFMEYWVNDIVVGQVEQTTYMSYKNTVMVHVVPYFKAKNVMLQDLNTSHIQEYIKSKMTNNTATSTKELSANSVKKHYLNISSALDYAVKTKLICINPAKNVELPKIKKFVGNYYTVQQLDVLLNVARDKPVESAIVLAVHYGLRRGEILGLRWSDVNMGENTIHICNTRVRVNVEIEKAPKTASSMRTLPLLQKVKKYLTELKTKQEQNKILLGSEYKDNDYICKWSDGTPLKTGYVSHAFKSLLIENGLPIIRFHDLRHSTASYLLKTGLSMKEIQFWLGHAQISTTMDIYTHIDTQMRNNIGEKIENLFSF